MGLAFHFRLQPWHPISTAPCNRDVELRVADGTAISRLEFPCQQTNAGNWINSDLSTPIRVQPVAWRVWQYGQSPQLPHQPLKVKRRSALPQRGQRIGKRPPLQHVKRFDQTLRRKKLAAAAYVLIGMVIVASAAISLTQISARALPIASAEPAPPAAVHAAAAKPWRAERSCKDFGFSFLNAACATHPKKHVFRGPHRVATLVIGRPDAPQ